MATSGARNAGAASADAGGAVGLDYNKLIMYLQQVGTEDVVAEMRAPWDAPPQHNNKNAF
jgi:hypothetical protein